MNRSRIMATIATAVLCQLTLPIALWASSIDHDQDPERVPYKSVVPLFESTVDRTALVAARHIAKGRFYLHRKNLQATSRELSEAVGLLETITDDLTAGPLKNRIRIARLHLSYDPPGKVLPEFTGMYEELHRISVYLPTDKSERHLKRAQKLLEDKDVRGAVKELSLADSFLISLEVEQPLGKALAGTVKARKYLAAGQAQKADNALQETESRLMSISSLLTAPLHGANESAWLAFSNFSTARKTATGAHLANTRKYLEQAGTRGTRGGEAIRQLSQHVAGLEKKLADKGTLEEAELKGVWEECKALAERGAAYFSTRISEEETTLKGEDFLIEARLHLAYAETDQLTTHEPDKADQELGTTYRLLEKAGGSPQVGPSDRKVIRQLSRLILRIQKAPENRSEAVSALYDEARQDLNGLLNRI